MKKIVSFCLWGDNQKYIHGAFENIKLMPTIYPGWTARFYVARPQWDIIHELSNWSNDPNFLSSSTKVEVVLLDEWEEDWRLMLARFLPASEDDVEVMISRDCDSRISHRERIAVEEWLDSPFLVHSMADHPWHFHPRQGLMGGMCGFKKFAYPEMSKKIEWFREITSPIWQCDQDFLKHNVLPEVINEIYPHSDLHNGCNRFPTRRRGLEFVGSVWDENDICTAEHLDVLEKALGISHD